MQGSRNHGLEIYPFHGVLLFPDGSYRIYTPSLVYEHHCEPASCTEQGKGVAIAWTDGIKSCVGVTAKARECEMLIHAYNPSNLDVLLEPMLQEWNSYTAQRPTLHLASRPPMQDRNFARLDLYHTVLKTRTPNSTLHWHPVESTSRIVVGTGSMSITNELSLFDWHRQYSELRRRPL